MHATAILLAFLPAAFAHIGMWHPSALDFDGDGYTLVTPLSGESFDRWWFHGNLGKPKPTEKFCLPVGKTVTVELSCEKKFTSYGSAGNGIDPCPDTPSSKHADNDESGSAFDESLLLGCGLAIAYKSEFKDVKPADFTVFSVNQKCVKDLKTAFDVPKVMPPCPSGGCICAWFWQGQSSADEMYMTGFRCDIEGGSSSASIASPKPPKYCPSGGCVSGPKQPLYWANDNSNIDYSGDYFEKPAYNSKWGFSDGAQNDIVSGAGYDAPTTTKVRVTAPDATTFSTVLRTASTTTTTMVVTRTRSGTSATPTSVCSWPGHCAGATCKTYNDCADNLVCLSGKVCGEMGTKNAYT